MRNITIVVNRGEVRLVDPEGEVTVLTPSSGRYLMLDEGVRVEFDANTDFIMTTARNIADLDQDGFVNFKDLRLMKESFFQEPDDNS